MKYQVAFEIVKKLPFDKETTIVKEEGIELYILRPSKLSKRFKDYDPKKNFQIWLRQGDRNFRPNHLRVIIDLHLRARSRPDLKRQLALIFDNIFYGNDPDEEIKKVSKEKFEHYLNPLRIIANLSQLFLIEQDYAYHKESNFDPPSLFYQGWLRQVIDDVKEIDNISMSTARGQPPLAKYNAKENKKSKKYTKNLKPFWYLNSGTSTPDRGQLKFGLPSNIKKSLF